MEDHKNRSFFKLHPNTWLNDQINENPSLSARNYSENRASKTYRKKYTHTYKDAFRNVRLEGSIDVNQYFERKETNINKQLFVNA